ncbi:hypothetical protein EDB84DRAFT_1578902 [Lactarius hengduanensis]|nr:hypothetical protein EDB84DRAFT_1578902 [Lactarius hengduanensis]
MQRAILQVAIGGSGDTSPASLPPHPAFTIFPRLRPKNAHGPAPAARALQHPPNQHSWTETAERIGVKRGNKARGKVDSARTAEHIGEINRENEDPYGAGGQSGKRAKPDARSAAANVNARERATIQPSRPPVPSPHTPAPVVHYIPSPLPLSQPATRPASPLPLPASLPPRLSTSRAHGPLPPQVPYYPPPFLSQPAPFVPQFTQYPFQMPHYAFYHPSQ